MNDRKQNVIDKAHQLFIEQGFQSTSIQDILEYSGISKGTFYNYFSSKNELLMDIFRRAFRKMEQDRNAMLIGADPSDPEVFINQIEFQMTSNRENKIIPLFEEVYFSSDQELKQFIGIGQFKTLRWFTERLADLTDTSSHPFLLDAAIMLNGILLQSIRFYQKANGDSASIRPVVSYSVKRILNMLENLPVSGEQLLPPEILNDWLPTSNTEDLDWRKKIHSLISRLKKSYSDNSEYSQKLAFLEEEILKSKAPRTFLIETVLSSMVDQNVNEFAELKELIDEKLFEKA